MPTFMQTVERLRERGLAPTHGRACLRGLSQQLGATPRGCFRAFQSKAFEAITQRKPWAVILCRYQGEPPNPILEGDVKKFFDAAFSPGSGGLFEYWRDVTFGVVDIGGSVVFDWVELDVPLSKAGAGSGMGRAATVDAAVRAIGGRNQDAVTGFFGQIAVVTHNWTIKGMVGVPDFTDPNDPLRPFYPNWIDGSAEGTKITLTPPFDGTITAHEMGHSFGMHHDVAPDLVVHYADPCCIMSQSHALPPPGFVQNFGPGICLPHLVQKGWMFPRRLYVDDGSWMSEAHGITLPLASLGDAGTRANLGLKLPFTRDGDSWDYYIEYVTPVSWNRGLLKPHVFIRRLANVPNLGETPVILGAIEVPGTPGKPTSFLEMSGRVLFEVHWNHMDARVLQVTAIRL